MTGVPSTPFSWDDDKDSVVLLEQPRTAVYTNPNGCIVIRQEAAWDEEVDPVIIIAPANIPTLVHVLQREAGVTPSPEPQKRITDQRPKVKGSGETQPSLLPAAE
jgi:hypothetical protein